MKFVKMNEERKYYKRPQMREIFVESESILAESEEKGGGTGATIPGGNGIIIG